MLEKLKEKLRAALGKREEGEKGFTLIELLAVIVILGIIAVIAIPLIGNIIDKSKKDSDLATARQIYDAARIFVVSENNGTFDGTITIKDTDADKTNDLTQAGYLESQIYLPSNKEMVTGGTVVFKDGELKSVNITTDKEYTTTKPKTFKGEDVLKQESSASSNNE